MNIFRYDKVVLVKEFYGMSAVGSAYEVANVTDTKVVLRDATSKVAVGAIGIEDFENHFKKPEEVHEWTAWQKLVNKSGDTIAFYRTNCKKVQVRLPNGIRSDAACNSKNGDDFDLYFGVNLAYERCTYKEWKNFVEEYEPLIKVAHSEMSECKHRIKMMINSLDKKAE